VNNDYVNDNYPYSEFKYFKNDLDL